MSGKLVLVGIGPGSIDCMTREVYAALGSANIVVGYSVYIELVKPFFPQKEYLSTPMKKEEERCRLALLKANSGNNVVFICGGDSGIYGLASLAYMIAYKEFKDVAIEVLPGVTAASAGASVLGAPLVTDFAVISLSDALTAWSTIEKRLRGASSADFCIVLYNPSSKKRFDYLKKACSVLLEVLPKNTVCGIVENISRDNENSVVCTLEELYNMRVNMFTTVFIGNSTTVNVNGKMITPRGYNYERSSALRGNN